MQPECEKLLRDILDAAQTIAGYTSDKSAEDYDQLRWLRECVQWNFTVIGEAMSQLHKVNAKLTEEISEWNRVIGFRNQLIHGYGVIQNHITWGIIQEKLPILQREVEELLNAR